VNGELMAREMAEQPRVLAALLERRDEIRAMVRRVLPEHLCGITLVARGSSDNAASYGRYLLEIVARRPAALSAPSIQTLYAAPVDNQGYLCIGISQSGQTPDVVEALEAMRTRGARTIAIVNGPASPLAAAAHGVVDLSAGEERAIPATKTFTATLVALAIIASALGEVPWSDHELMSLPEQFDTMLSDRDPAQRVGTGLASATRVLTTARGLLLSAALETALKIRETSMIFAEGLSAADLRHGPIVAVTPEVPVLAFSAPGPLAADVAALVDTLRRRGVPMTVVSPAPDADLPLPSTMPEALQPVFGAGRGQQVALAAARARGLDPDAPTGLSKITLAV
jgi:glutamine---fructose-6-phosphate transaminase (isomerizing)